MRISTSLLFDSGAMNIQRTQSATYKTQNQLSTGRRMLSPEDDPVAAAQALLTQQSKGVNNQYLENQVAAKNELGLLEGQLSSVGDLIQNVRERAVQLGSAVLSSADRSFIAEELRQRFDELVGIANSQNGLGQFLFSGYQGGTKPFSLQPSSGVAPFSAANPFAIYAGDEGKRLLQVDSTRQMAINAPGSELFMQIRQGNGTFAVSSNSAYAGTAIADQGSVTSHADWNASAIQPQDFAIRFESDATGAMFYNIVDAATGNTLFAPAAPGTPAGATPVSSGVDGWRAFTPGQAIAFTGLDPSFAPGASATSAGSLGIQVQVSGTPAAGDNFAVSASKNQSLFDTLQNIISAAVAPPGAAGSGNALLSNRLGESLAALDQAIDNTLRVRATVGAQLLEIDSLGSAGSAKNLHYEKRLSELQDVDYAEAISRLSKQQMQLEAAQRSFTRITGLSLFNFL